MADSKISALSSGAPAQAGDEYIVARSGSNYKLTLTNIAANMPATTVASGDLVVSSGNVGIGTSAAGFGDLTVLKQTTTSTNATLSLVSGTSGYGRLFFGDAQNSNAEFDGFIQYDQGNRLMQFGTAQAERMRIDSEGRVGIGGTPSASSKVFVTGTLPSSSNLSTGFRQGGTIPSATTSAYIGFFSFPTTEAASFTLGAASGFTAAAQAFGAGSTVTTQIGFEAASSLTGATNNYGFFSNIASGSGRWNFFANGTARNYFAGGVEDANGNLRKIPKSGTAKTTSYTLQTSDVGLFIEVGSGGSITVPDATFAAGDVVSIFNNTTGNVTLTMSITTAYIGGTDSDKATITLATRGVATVLFISGTVCVVNGNVS
jgi:hypothetical protein